MNVNEQPQDGTLHAVEPEVALPSAITQRLTASKPPANITIRESD